MEYLMTYGWAILIIAVILAALDFLGVFNTGTFIGQSCLATPGYLCSNPVMTANTTGPNLLSFNFEQDTGQPIYEVSFACSASSNSSTGMPNANTANVFQFATSAMSSGSSFNISGMQCYGSNANLFKDNPIGTVFSGTLWIQYTTVPASTNYQYAKVARITAKVEAMSSAPSSLGAPSAPGFSGPQTTPSNILYYAPLRISNPGGPTPSSVPSGIVSYVPITITNAANVPTSAPFQQMVNITESSFSAIAYNNNLANFEFFTQSGTVIPAWIESNSSGKLITWVNLPTSIPASSSVTIYIGFASKTTNLLSSSGPIGEAPQLSSTYAEYDDGAGIFTNYWNFAGTSLPSGFNSLANDGTYSVNNGLILSLPPTTTSTAWIHVFTTSQYAPSIVESYVSSQTSLSPGEYDIAYTTVETATGGDAGYQTAYRFDNYLNYNRIVKDVAGIGPKIAGAAFTLPSSFIISGFWSATGNEYMQINYANQLSTTNTSITYANANLDLFVYVYINSSTAITTTTDWLRTRAYPPNGAMPTVTFDFPQATGTGFQQMVNITESSFSSYLTYNSNFANFEYFYANGTIIPSWIESNNSGKLVTWAKLSKSIPASSNTTIYLGFASKTTNLLSSSGTTGIGEAPQLSATYAEYDDGASVFNNYWNFVGTNLPSGWTISSTSSGTTGAITVNNGITISNPSNGWYGIITTTNFNPQAVIVDFYGYSSTFVTAVTMNFGYNNLSQGTTPYTLYAISNGESGTEYGLSNREGVYGTTISIGGTTISTLYIFSLWASSSASYAMTNYRTIYDNAENFIPEILAPIDAYTMSPTIYLQWLRTRAYPPNGVMPTVTFGAVS